MGVDGKTSIINFDQWYKTVELDSRNGCFRNVSLTEQAEALRRRYRDYKSEMDARCAGFEKLEKQVDAEVVSEKPDLPNVSSGEVAGLIRRMSRNLVQNVPNVEIVNEFDDDSVNGYLSRYVLLSKIVESDSYSNDMQQNLFASTKTALTVGFDCVVPVLLQRADDEWYIKYDSIHYRDVFPEPGAKDVRDANDVFVRRYLTPGDMRALIHSNAAGWDMDALKTVLEQVPSTPPREYQSNAHSDKKRGVHASGYEVITWYSSTGEPFLTFCGRTGYLLRVERNKHPLKWHPVFFLVPERDSQHPLGKSQVELVYGRQEFQDLMHNGAMKLWYRNINPPLLGYGAPNALPNLSPGKYNPISNPNAKIEPFEINTQTLMQYPTLAQNNLGSMVNLVGAADQQMAVQAGNGMSATPQGVEAQQAMVDITTNNYQKAIESFFSRYCSYALTIYFQEMKGISELLVTSDTRQRLLKAGLNAEHFKDDGTLRVNMTDMATVYYVRTVPGSLVEMEDEKQLRILNQLFVPLSQALPALAQLDDRTALANAADALQFIISKEIELSGFTAADELKKRFNGSFTDADALETLDEDVLDGEISSIVTNTVFGQEQLLQVVVGMQEQLALLSQTQAAILGRLGVPIEPSNAIAGETPQEIMPREEPAGMVVNARA